MLYEKGLVNQAGQVLIPPGTVGAVSAALIIDPVLTSVASFRASNDARRNVRRLDFGGHYRRARRVHDCSHDATAGPLTEQVD